MPTNLSHLMAVAVDHRHDFKPPAWKSRCRLRSFPHPDPNLIDSSPDHAVAAAFASSSSTRKTSKKSSVGPSFCRSLSTPCFSTSAAAAAAAHNDLIARIEIVGTHQSRGIQALVVEAAVSLAFGAQAVPVAHGLSGAYYLRNRSGENFAVIKPFDEEQPPLSLLCRSAGTVKHPVRVAEAVVHEVAAYLLDHGGFSGVPPTALVRISHPNLTPNRKMASIQRFVPHDFDAGELGPSRFSVAAVHRIGILDVRLLNLDRHAGNILVRNHKHARRSHDRYEGYSNDSVTELVPIDHGLCLPELLEDPYFEWLHWPQASVPFSDAEVEYISALDPFRDAELLRSELPSIKESSIRILIFCTIFLKKAAAAGLCLADIGDMMTREYLSSFEEGPSALEVLCKQVEASMNTITPFEEADDDDDRSTSPPMSTSTGDEAKEFQFEMDRDDEYDEEESDGGSVVDVPLLLQGSRAKNRSMDGHLEVLVPVHKMESSADEGSNAGGKLGSIAKSVSFSAVDFNHDGCKSISFKDLSEEEWSLFLERFEQLLPEALEATQSMALKQRLGTSCKF